MKINLIKCPTGKYKVVGFKIPNDLAYRHVSGRNLTSEEAQQVHQCGIGFCSSFARTVVWDNAEAATEDIISRYPQACVVPVINAHD